MTAVDRDQLAAWLLDLVGVCPPPFDSITEAEWPLLEQLAADQRLQPMLHHRHRDNKAIPADLRARWAKAHRTSAVQALAQNEDLGHCTTLLREAGFRPIALKGAWLARHAYPHPALRPLRDIDLLLDAETVIPAFTLLEARGYRRYETDRLVELEPFLATDKHLPPLIAQHGTPIELHHRLWAADGLLDHASPSAMDNRVRDRAVGDGTGLLYPCNEDMIAHLVIHAVYGHRLDCGPLVLTDLDYQLRREPLDWSAFWTRAAVEGWRPGARLLLELAAQHCATPVDLSHDPGPPIPHEIMAAAPRMLVQDPVARSSTYALARAARHGLSALAKRVKSRSTATAPAAISAGSRAKSVLLDALKRDVRRATADMTRLSAWLDSQP